MTKKLGASSVAAKKAQARLDEAINAGYVIRRPCEVCGEEPAEGHHVDYSWPLEVRWFCKLHRDQEHGRQLK